MKMLAVANLQIGNAVPPIFGEVIAQQIMKSIQSTPSINRHEC